MEGAGSPGADDPRRFQHPVLRGVRFPEVGTPQRILADALIRVKQRMRGDIEAADGPALGHVVLVPRARTTAPQARTELVLARQYGGQLFVRRKGLTVQAIVRAVARYHDLTVADLRGPGKARAVAWPRQEAMFLAREAGFALTVIGRELGGRDHTTIISGCRAVEGRLATDARTVIALAGVRARLVYGGGGA